MLFDLLKVRKLVDEAADLAVRAQNGTASSALNTENGLPGAALGLNTRGGAGANARLSPERKYRMRELATAKLSQAYRLDEVAASVATMQSASALDTVASLVLQRAPANTDAQYVHFFHERIPSRMMAECTPLEPLNQIIAREGSHAAPYRTRALTKIFKDDFLGSAQDLTEALAICRAEQAKNGCGKNQLISMKQAREDAERRKIWTREWMSENKVPEDDQPKGMEMQLLFQRGNQYLTLASAHLKKALEAFKLSKMHDPSTHPTSDLPNQQLDGGSVDTGASPPKDVENYRRGLDAREQVRKYAKRALRDYTTFFSRLDYAYAYEPQGRNIFDRGRILGEERSGASSDTSSAVDADTSSQALVRRERPSSPSSENSSSFPSEPAIHTYDISLLLSSTPPADLPPFPSPKLPSTSSDVLANTQSHEMLTYHPLLPETLHSFLLTHCLLQTDPTTLHRIANNAARLSRLADGYPFFLSARSPARADWAEILRQTRNWIGLSGSWDTLCKIDSQNEKVGKNSASPRAYGEMTKPAKTKKKPADESPEQQRDRIHKEAVMEALGDERVVDDESFQKAVTAREKRALRDIDPSASPSSASTPSSSLTPVITGGSPQPPKTTTGQPSSSTLEPSTASGSSKPDAGEPFGRGRGINGPGSPVAKDEEYLIGTERAECIARWVMEAPVNPPALEGSATVKSKRKKKARKPVGLREGVSDSSVLTEMTAEG